MQRIRMSYSQSRELQELLSDRERSAIRPATDGGAGFELFSDDPAVVMAAKLIGISVEETG